MFVSSSSLKYQSIYIRISSVIPILATLGLFAFMFPISGKHMNILMKMYYVHSIFVERLVSPSHRFRRMCDL